MTATQAKIALALAGIVVWGYGYSADMPWVRWAGIGLLAAAFVLRFLFRRAPADKG